MDFTANPVDHQVSGKPVKFVAKADDPNRNDPIYYRFFVDGVEAQGWSQSNLWIMDTSSYDGGKHIISVLAKDGKHNEDKDSYWDLNYIIESAKITDPGENDRVNMTPVIKGTSKGIPRADWLKRFWIFIKNPNGYYHPQFEMKNILENGNWSAGCYIGGVNEKNTVYQVLAVLANESAEIKIDDYWTRGKYNESHNLLCMARY